MHRTPSSLWDRQERKRMQNNANISSGPRRPGGGGCFCTTGFSSQLLHTVPAEGCVFPPAPVVTQANFPGCFQTQKVYFLKADTRLPNAGGPKCSPAPGPAAPARPGAPTAIPFEGPRSARGRPRRWAPSPSPAGSAAAWLARREHSKL